MSSILKALRKLEEEKARRQGDSPDIARDILRHGPRRTPRGKGSLYAAVAVMLVFVICAAFWLLNGSKGTSSPAPASTVAVEPVAVEPVAVKPVAVKPVAVKPVAVKPVAVKPVAVEWSHLVLSGIAYQEAPEGRLAVVNDLPVMQGTVIEGARVEEILRDRVRFSMAGRAFEVALEDTGRD